MAKGMAALVAMAGAAWDRQDYLGAAAAIARSILDKLVVERADASRIKETAVAEGMKTLVRDGAEKALAGITTIEEILRVSGTVQ